jgi:hypothetical protein
MHWILSRSTNPLHRHHARDSSKQHDIDAVARLAREPIIHALEKRHHRVSSPGLCSDLLSRPHRLFVNALEVDIQWPGAFKHEVDRPAIDAVERGSFDMMAGELVWRRVIEIPL